MENTATLRADNANLRKIQAKLVQWELKENPLAPLSTAQTDFINRLSDLATGNVAPNGETPTDTVEKSSEPTEELPASLEQFKQSACVIDSTQNFLSWYNSIDAEILEHFDDVYLEYYEQLRSRAGECDHMLKEIDVSLESLGKLTQEFNFVSEKTSSLHEASESLLQDQTKLSDTGEEIRKRLKYFTQAESISQRLHNPTFSVSNDTFVDILNTIDDCIEYMRVNPTFSEASAYSVKYRTCLAKATQMMKTYVTNILSNATAQVMAPKGSGAPKSLEALEQPKVGDRSAEAAFALFYGKFQASSSRVQRITAMIEERLDRSPDYEQLLGELHQTYLTQRAAIMSTGVDQAIKDLAKKHKGDHCALVRSACAFMVHISQDEHRLFYQFFAKPSGQLIGYMEGLCTILYDTLRPYIIRIDHLETLAEICSILKVEMLDEHVTYSPDSLEAFAKIVYQLLQDVQERIGFRAQNYLESDIRNYKPSAGDLAYPEKLEMMESIALSLQDNSHHYHHNPHQHLRRADSRSSITSGVSMDTSLDATAPTAEHTLKVRSGNSPADLHGMWYPTVRRTLVCLSRLYRCIDKSIFQSLSQQALTHCIHSVSSAAAQIAQSRTTIDGELFEIKHLLILREQIAPFRVDFTAKETSLDFSKVRTAAYELLQKRKQLFSLGSNNALLEFLLDGTPQVREQLLDSRKDVDRQLKTVCETFIRDATKQLVGPVLTFIESAQGYVKNQPSAGKSGAAGAASGGAVAQSTGMALRMAPFAAPQQISSIIQECLRNIKSKLSGLQRSMQLYLANKDTEFILFRPIRNNIIGAFVKLEQILLLNAYTKDDLTIVSCPSAEQISVLLSSVNLAGSGTSDPTVAAFGKTQTTDAQRKISTSSISSAGSTKAPIEKKVSFDSGANTVVEIERIEVVGESLGETEIEQGKEVLVADQDSLVGEKNAEAKSIGVEAERA
ncbi:conserved oligomeric Golgi complex subunit 3 isoform X1 [Anopheles ziemanni]|uniref:conserved oligomeric Golgi complex subunit 3 isoform X1 n=1 Tax=Anopheles coustani TaxID=139045 RepID=UPI002659B7AF|nr:conserved oligomeric Golgi complex subunit 3 isoform X1 [Anopheles coustani]XP_058171443.1 conserved oligomeric Golgi complex subunit 3 isoform X1 [Anopheles ziemanni]